MSSMASTSSASSLKGFSVLQPGLGAPLSWMPAVGSKELAQLIDAYLPGPASAQDKRAAIATDFFKFAAETGESFKYYPVNLAQAAPSPASSSFSTSPAMSNVSCGSPSQPSTPAPRATTSARASAVKSGKTDYSHLPGMKILTTDGEDVTNSLSRGCKSKEQREHAHLMRVLKACDACKKKKIRCDPSHKRRTSSQASAKAVTKPAKKARKAASPSASASQAASAPCTSASLTPATGLDFDFDFDFHMDMDLAASLDALPSMDMNELFNFDQALDTVPQDFYSAVPQSFDFYLGNDSLYSPAMTGSNSSFNSPAQPLTPTSSGLLPQGDFTFFNDTNAQAFVQAGGQQPGLPYMTPGPHGSDYTDFNLYSPGSSFIDEEPMTLRASGKRNDSASSDQSPATQSQHTPGNDSPAGLLHKARSSSGLADDQQWYFDRLGHGTVNPQMLRSPIPCDQLQQQHAVAGESAGGSTYRWDQQPYHGDDGGHDSPRAATTTRLPGTLQQSVSRNSPVSVTALSEGSERFSSPACTSTVANSPLSSLVSSPASSPQSIHLDAISRGGSARTISRTVCPTQLHTEVSSRLTSLPQITVESQSLPAGALPLTSLSPSDRSDGRLVAGGHPADGRLIVNGELSQINRGLQVNEGLSAGALSSRGRLLPRSGLQSFPADNGQHSSAIVATSSRPTAASALASHEAIQAQLLGFGSTAGRAALLRRLDEESRILGISTASTTVMASGLGLLNPSQQQRQVLPGKLGNVATGSFTPRRPRQPESDETTFLSVRQTLGHTASTTRSLLTHLALLGLVFLLLIVGLTSLMQMQSLPLLDHLPSCSKYLVILSLLLTPLPHNSASSALDTARSIPSGTASRRHQLGRAASAGLARVSLACL